MSANAFRIRFVLLLSALPAAAALAQGLDPFHQRIKEWTLVCDNAGRCEAAALADGNPATLRIARDAGAAAQPVLRLRAPGALRPDDLRIDGQAPAGLDWGQPTGRGASSELTLDAPRARTAIGLLRNANQLQLGPGEDAMRVSLAGMTATLLAMDAQQGRLDTEGALLRDGPLPDTRARAPQALPRIAQRPLSTRPVEAGVLDAVREAQGKWVASVCGGRPDDPRDTAHPLTDTHALVMLECRREGERSWFFGFQAERTRPDQAQVATTEMVSGAQELRDDGWLNPTLDPATGTLQVIAFDAPDRTCGYRARWRFDGRFFRLVDYREQAVCAGLPEDWAVWYRTVPAP